MFNVFMQCDRRSFCLQYSMSSPSFAVIRKQPYLPLLDHFSKSKKYQYQQSNKQNALKDDIDHIITTLAGHPTPCQLKLQQLQRKYLAQKIHPSTHKVATQSTHALFTPALKAIRTEIISYMDKFGQAQSLPKGDYAEFVRLSQESQDYLEFYLKHHFKQAENLELLKTQEKAVILSLMKNNYKCLTDNPPQIANRILLSLGLNPLNDFHFVHWHAFSRFRKLASRNCSKSEAKLFFVDYLLPSSHKTISKSQFWAIVGAVIRKLESIINKNNVGRLIERVEAVGSEIVPEEMDRQALQSVLISEPLFLWEELVQLIFLI